MVFQKCRPAAGKYRFLFGDTQGGFCLCKFTYENEMGLGCGIYLIIYQAWGITLVAYYFPFSRCLPPSTGGICKCALTAEVTLSRPLDLGAVCLHLPQYLQMPGKEKVIFCAWPAGKSEANDLGHADCYLAPRIAACF